ncbi:MAG: helix-turn-helix domain-containing protein [bacterium]|nr:helix-turn-helix domain-containing protein [bacterium]MCM1374337.1 helix-turn-helix domain-containing protein [Muribaculum sp.]
MKKDYVTMMRELREDHDLRQKEVAAYLKIDQRVYSRYETGRNALPIEKAISLCEFYQVSADYFLGLDTKKRKK